MKILVMKIIAFLLDIHGLPLESLLDMKVWHEGTFDGSIETEIQITTHLFTCTRKVRHSRSNHSWKNQIIFILELVNTILFVRPSCKICFLLLFSVGLRKGPPRNVFSIRRRLFYSLKQHFDMKRGIF